MRRRTAHPRCRDCGRHVWAPQRICPGCRGAAFDWPVVARPPPSSPGPAPGTPSCRTRRPRPLHRGPGPTRRGPLGTPAGHARRRREHPADRSRPARRDPARGPAHP
ncbi:zinc ribbon domain-containing protein [Streptomyces sp. INA 01156]